MDQPEAAGAAAGAGAGVGAAEDESGESEGLNPDVRGDEVY